MTKKRVMWADAAKGIAIMLVVYGHAIEGTFDSHVGLNSVAYYFQHEFIYSFHMPIFFFISGMFALNWSQRKFGVAIKQKATALIYPYFVWGILQGLVMLLMQDYTRDGKGWKTILELPIHPYDQFWFIYDLFFVFLLFYILKKFISKNLTILIISFVFVMISPWVHFWELGIIFYNFFYFTLGLYLYNSGYLEKILKHGWIYVVLSIALFTVLFMNKVDVNMILARVPLAVLGVFGCIYISQKLQNVKFLNYVGQLSLEIYLMHWFAVAGSRIILIKLGFRNVIGLVIIETVLGILVPILMYKIFEKLHINKFLFAR